MSVTITKVQHIGCITALHLHPPNQPIRLLVACGSTLHVYNYPALQLQASHQWHYHAHRIHGITSHDNIICIWGGKHTQLLILTPTTITPYTNPLRLKDHIWTAACLTCPPTCSATTPTSPPHPTFQLVLGLAHNSVAVCSVALPGGGGGGGGGGLLVELVVEVEVVCGVRSLLYSVSFWGRCWHELCVVAGTVFSSIVVWSVHPAARITHTLTGHTGVIFNTCTSSSPSSSSSSSSSAASFLVYSVSDDRTVRSFSLAADGSWQLLSTGWGHEARVFRLATTAAGSLISGGEDDTVRVWSNGTETGAWSERGRKGGVWALAVDERSGRVLAGLGDGRVRVVDFSATLCAHMPQRQSVVGKTTQQQQGVQHWDLAAFASAGEASIIDQVLPPTQRKAAAAAVESKMEEAVETKHAVERTELEYCRAITNGEDGELFMATSTGRILHITLPLSANLPATQQPVTTLLYHYPSHASINTLSLSFNGRFLAAGDSRGGLLLLSLTRAGPSAVHSTECWWHRAAVYTTAISFMHFFLLSSSSYLMTADALGEVRWWRIDTADQPAIVELTEMSNFRLPLRTHVTCAALVHSAQPSDVAQQGTTEDEDDRDESETEREMMESDTSGESAERLLICGDSRGNVYVYQLSLTEASLTVYASSRLSAVHNSVSALQPLSSSRMISVGKDATLLSYSIHRSTEPPSALDSAWIDKHNTALSASSPPPPAHRFVLLATSTTRVGIPQLYGILPSPTTVSSSSPLVYGFSSSDFKVYDSERQLQLMAVPCGGSKRPYVCLLSSSSDSASKPPALHFLYTAHSTVGCTLVHHRLPLQSAVTQSDNLGDACHTRLTTAVSAITLRSSNRSTRLLLTTGEDSLFKVWLLSNDAHSHVRLLHTVNEHPETIRALAVVKCGDGSVYAFTGGGRDCLYAYHLRRREDEQGGVADEAVDVIRSGQAGGANVRMKGKSWLKREQSKNDSDQLDVMDVRILSAIALPHPRSTTTHFCCIVVTGDSVGRLRFYHYSAAAAAFDLVAASTSHARPVLSMAACDNVMASGDTVGRMRLWDVSSPATPHELGMLDLHQAGVNCCALQAVSSTSYRLLTSGDDGCIGVVTFTLSPGFAVVSRVVHPFMHGSAIRCMRLREEDGLVLTSGYDQRLRVWRVGAADGSLQRVGQCALELADVSGLAVLADLVAVVGAGMSTLRVSAQLALCCRLELKASRSS